MVRQEVLGPKGSDNKRSINKNLAIADKGYVFAYDKNGINVMNPIDEGKNMMNYQTPDGVMLGKEVVQKGTKGGGYISYQYQVPGTNTVSTKITYAELEPNWGWIVAQGAYVTDFNQGANKVLYLLLIALGASLIAGALIVYIFANRISRPIIAVAKGAKEMANGNLAIEDIQVISRDEVGALANDFNEMKNNLRNIIIKVGTNAEQVAAAAEQLNASAEETSKSSEHITSVVQELSIGSEKQAQEIEESTHSISEMSSNIKQIADNTQNVSSDAQKTSKNTTEGNRAITPSYY